MESRIMQVFYGNDLLPYKDSERAVHYPIVGNSFAGSNLTNEIHFYIDRIGGTDGISWVIVSKLPDGKIGYEPLSTIVHDSLLAEDYLLFSLSSYYTSVKGDLFLALRGYKGTVTFTDTNDDGIYEINGDPLIEVTGTIKLAINYSPMINTGTQVLPSDVDRLIAALSNYSLRANTMEFVRYNASGKTIAQLVTSLGDTSNIVHSFWFSNITNNGRYIGFVIKNGSDKYDLELERYAAGVRTSQDRWVARNLNGDELIETVLTTYNEYYAPYLVNGNVIDYDNETYGDLHTKIGEVPHIIRLNGTSEDSLTYGGYYIVKLGSGTLMALRLTTISDGIYDFYYGYSISDSTALSDIFKHSSSYYKPYLSKNEAQSTYLSILDAQSTYLSKVDAQSTYLTKTDAEGKFLKKFSSGITNSTTLLQLEEIIGSEPCYIYNSSQQSWYLCKLFNANHYYYFEFEEVGMSMNNGTYSNRYEGSAGESTTLGTILTPSSSYYKPYFVQGEDTLNVGGEIILGGSAEIFYNLNETVSITSDGSNGIVVDGDTLTDTNGVEFAKKTYVDGQITNVVELAEGKCNSFVLSYSDTVNSDNYAKYYYLNSNKEAVAFTSKQELENYIYQCTCMNSAFNSQNNNVVVGNASDSVYLIIRETNLSVSGGDVPTYLILKKTGTSGFQNISLNIGDVFLVLETDVPDRWLSHEAYGPDGAIFSKMETTKVDLTNYYTKSESLVPSLNNTYNLGDSGYKWKTLYIGGEIQVGGKISIDTNNSIDILDIKHTGTTVYRFSTSALYPNTNNSIDLGASSYTWKDLYLGGKVYLNASSTTTITTNASGEIVVDRNGTTIFNFGNTNGITQCYYSFQPIIDNHASIGSTTNRWNNIYFAGYLNSGSRTASLLELSAQFNINEAGTTEIKWTKMLTFSLSADTTFTFETAKTGCLNEYKGIITNSGASSITLTFPSGVKILTNDDENVIVSSNTISLTAGTTIEISCVNNNLVAINFDAQ